MDLRTRLRRAFDSLVGDEPPAAPVEATRADSGVEGVHTGIGNATYDKGAAKIPNVRGWQLSDQHLEGLCATGGLWHRVVHHLPAEGTRRGWTASVGTERDAFLEFDDALGVQAVMREAWAAARQWGLGVVLMVDARTDVDLSEPMPEGAEIMRLQVFERPELSVREWDRDPTSPTFREPLVWSITPRGYGAGGGSLTVHTSRLLKLYGPRLPRSGTRYTKDVPAVSVIEHYWDALSDHMLVNRAGATIVQELIVKVLRIAGLDAKAAENTKTVVEQRTRAFARSLGLVGVAVIPKEDEVQIHGVPATGFADLASNARQAVCSVEGWPATELWGDTPSGLNTDGASAKQSWGRVVGSGQEDVLRPALTALYRHAARSRGIDPAQVVIEFRPLHDPTPAELADVRLKRADADAKLVAAGIADPMAVALTRFVDPEDPDEIRMTEQEVRAFFDAAAEREAVAAELAAETAMPPDDSPDEDVVDDEPADDAAA